MLGSNRTSLILEAGHVEGNVATAIVNTRQAPRAMMPPRAVDETL